MLRELLAVATGGALGAVLRYGATRGLQHLVREAFPLGTLVVNVVGCLALGLLMTWNEARGPLDPRLRLFLGVGLLGAFTTFSTFGWELVELVRQGYTGRALAYLGGNLGLGLLAVLLGRALAGGGAPPG